MELRRDLHLEIGWGAAASQSGYVSGGPPCNLRPLERTCRVGLCWLGPTKSNHTKPPPSDCRNLARLCMQLMSTCTHHPAAVSLLPRCGLQARITQIRPAPGFVSPRVTVHVTPEKDLLGGNVTARFLVHIYIPQIFHDDSHFCRWRNEHNN